MICDICGGCGSFEIYDEDMLHISVSPCTHCYSNGIKIPRSPRKDISKILDAVIKRAERARARNKKMRVVR